MKKLSPLSSPVDIVCRRRSLNEVDVNQHWIQLKKKREPRDSHKDWYTRTKKLSNQRYAVYQFPVGQRTISAVDTDVGAAIRFDRKESRSLE